MPGKKLYIIAGEASGDLHGSNLVKELSKKLEFEMRGMGGEKLRAAGVDIIQHYREVNFIGFVEVVKNLRTVLKKINTIKKDILAYRPEAVILVDFPAFNMRIAKFCKQQGIKVIYYISPQIWAWKQGRVKQIRTDVDKMITILPFEKDFYKKFDVEVEYAGHPLLDALQSYPYNEEFIQSLRQKAGHKKIIALLPGSRKAEITSKLPVMLEIAEKYKDQYHFVIAGAPGAKKRLYEHIGNTDIYFGETYNILKASYAALVTSGTATLETALHRVPQVVCYKMAEMNYQLAKRVIKVKYITLVNLILDKLSVVELIQRDLNFKRLEEEFLQITGDKREAILKDYDEVIRILGNSGASEKAATYIQQELI